MTTISVGDALRVKSGIITVDITFSCLNGSIVARIASAKVLGMGFLVGLIRSKATAMITALFAGRENVTVTKDLQDNLILTVQDFYVEEIEVKDGRMRLVFRSA